MIVAVINNKGGTGKTTVSVNLAAALANKGFRVLLVDLDCQGSASRSLLEGSVTAGLTAADVLLHQAPAGDAVVQTRVRRLHLMPGGMELAHTDLVLADVPGREDRLKDALATLTNQYDLILCDCAPSLSMLPVNALLASDGYLVPLSPEHLAFEGLGSLMEAVDRIEEGMEVKLNLVGIVLTMVKAGRFAGWTREARDQRDIIGRVKARYGQDVFETVIRKAPAIARAPVRALTVAEEEPGGRGADDFEALAREFMARVGPALSTKGAEQQETAKNNVEIGEEGA